MWVDPRAQDHLGRRRIRGGDRINADLVQDDVERAVSSYWAERFLFAIRGRSLSLTARSKIAQIGLCSLL
jgi:hypothetical protein